MESLVGKFLLAGPALLDPNFVRTVVLVIRHDDDGAFGLVINRPTKISIADAMGAEMDAAATVGDPIYFGGPCQGPVFILHTESSVGGDEAVPGVFTTTDREAIESLLQTQSEPLKIFASYSGWGAGQLENELEEGGWLICEASLEEVFAVDPNHWSRLFTRINISRFVSPDRIPDDPSVN
ncbi:MAG: YqgE/AlgH family protein [Burkholderiales bacterium]|nr:YqgE/AlgH family protein [Phycisphaerae bacterium]